MFHYRHSNWMKSGDSWPWVAASAVEGLEELTLHDLKPGRYTVRLHFAELKDVEAGGRVQSISLQGNAALTDFDVRSTAKATMTGIVEESDDVIVDGTLTINFQSIRGKSLISGIEIIRRHDR
jgi:hypothetical protein